MCLAATVAVNGLRQCVVDIVLDTIYGMEVHYIEWHHMLIYEGSCEI